MVTLFPLSSTASLVPFCAERCLPEGFLPKEQGTAAPSVPPLLQDAPQPEREMPDWSRTMRDPFEGKWDLICSLVLAHPEWSGRTLFQELQQLFPGSYQSSQLSMLQVGLRKIRAWFLELGKEPDSQKVIQAEVVASSAFQADRQQRERTPDPVCVRQMRMHMHSHEEGDQSIKQGCSQEPMVLIATEENCRGSKESNQQTQESQLHCFTMTIASAIEGYLRAQKDAGRSQKTLQWHRIALGFLQQYLVEERQLRFLGQLTENELREKLGAALVWRGAYVEQVRLLDAQGNAIDARQARIKVQQLDDLINVMRLQLKEEAAGHYIPLHKILPSPHRKREDHHETQD